LHTIQPKIFTSETKQARTSTYIGLLKEEQEKNRALDFLSQVQAWEFSVGLQTTLGFVFAQSGLEMGQT
jgi:hypothetical protein